MKPSKLSNIHCSTLWMLHHNQFKTVLSDYFLTILSASERSLWKCSSSASHTGNSDSPTNNN